MTWSDLSGTPIATSPSPSPYTFLGKSWKIGAVSAIATTPQAVYALYVPPGTQGSLQGAANEMLARIDRASGDVKTTGPFPGALSIAPGGQWIWLTANHVLVQIDPATLHEMNSTSLPGTSNNADANIAGNPQGLWLAYGSSLYRLDTSSGEPTQRASLDGKATGISIDPIGRELYVGSDACGPNSSGVVSEWDAGNLRKVASAATGGGCLGGPGVSASKDGVWVAYATGMLGQIEHLHAIGLTEVPTSHAATTNSIRVVAVNNMVWAIDAMAGKVECLDQQTGKARVGWADSEAMVIAGDSQGLYLGSVSGLSVLVVDRRCQ